MEYPSIKIIDKEINLLSEIDLYTSLRYRRSWQGVGDFEVHIVGNDTSLAEGNIIVLGGNGHKAGIIRSVQYAVGANGIITTVTGQTLNGIASQRVVLPKKGDGGYYRVPPYSADIQPVPAETIIKEYARSCLHPTESDIVNGSDTKRIIDNLIIADDLKRGLSSVWQARYDCLPDVLCAISEYCDIGWEIYVDFDKKCFVFDVCTGVDRSANQTDNSTVIISREFDGADSITYTFDTQNHKNVAYCGGAGENEDRTIIKVSPENAETEAEGFDRSEVFLDCGSLGLTETQTEMSLENEGRHKLQDYSTVENFSGNILPYSSFKYESHWNLGDLVTVTERSIGKTQDLRISEVEEAYETSGKSVSVTFGKAPAHLGRIIRTLKSIIR